MRNRLEGVWQFAAVALLLGAVACEGPSDPMVRGAARYDQCAPCHGAKGEGKPALAAPPIGGLPRWYVEAQLDKFRIGARGAHLEDSAGLRMRTMALTLPAEREVQVVAHYVSSLPHAASAPSVSGGDSTRGKAAYAACASCHGVDGAGNPQLNAPPIAGQADWYVATQLANFKRGIRGAKPGDATGATMKAMAVGLDEQQIKDLAAWVASMPRG
ncbi:MAG: c-type cytochrome [Deltaproteobacteria bacterium]|nr:c-type cytochrome [Deltaproteobacteria bacterium]